MSSSPSPAPDLAAAPPLATRAVGGFGASIAAGAAIGAASWVSDELGYPAGLLIPANLIGVWLGLAFVLGASARTIPTGGLRGLVGLMSAVVVYYLLISLLGDGVRAIGATHAATVWGGVAIVMGPLLGAAGGAWRHSTGWPRALGVGLLAAALIGEGIVFAGGRLARFDPVVDPGSLILAVEIVIGSVLPFVLLRPGERARGYLATVGLAAIAAAAIGPVTTVVRGIADTF